MSQSRSDNTSSLADIARGLASDVQDLVRGEIALAGSELDAKFQHVMLATMWLLGGALVGFAGLVVVLMGVAAILGRMMPAWAALLLVGGTIVVGGAVLAKCGLDMLSVRALTPDRTAANLQKDANMLKEHT